MFKMEIWQSTLIILDPNFDGIASVWLTAGSLNSVLPAC